MIRIPRWPAIRLAVFVAAVLVVAVLGRVIADAGAPRIVASSTELAAQQASAERGIQRAYLAAADQLHKARALRLPISDAQAAAIEQRNIDDLRTLRHNAFVSIGVSFNFSSSEAESYAKTTEQRMDAAGAASPSPLPQVLLAPKIFAIVQRMDEVAAQIADRGTREMTVAPSPSPTPVTSPTPTASATPTPRPSVSPTRSP